MDLKTAQWRRGTGWTGLCPADDGPDNLVLAFGGSSLIDEPDSLADLAAAYPTSCVIGCSTAGEIRDDTVTDDTVVVATAKFQSTRLCLTHAPVPDPSASYDVGRKLAADLRASVEDLAGIFVLSDGLLVNGSALVTGLVDGSAGQVTISGGLAGDGDRFERSWVLVDGVPRSGYVTAVGFSGPNIRLGHGSRGGWDIFGPERRVTRSVGNVLYELDGVPALELYKHYLGDRAAGLPATALLFPLSVGLPGTNDRTVVRTVLAIDDEAQSMTFAGDVPQGSAAQLMRANFDRLIDGAHVAASTAEVPAAGPVLAIAISCVGRRLVLGQRTEDELEAALDGLPVGTHLAGFYSYGEISSTAAGTCDLHNQTMTVTTISEAA